MQDASKITMTTQLTLAWVIVASCFLLLPVTSRADVSPAASQPSTVEHQPIGDAKQASQDDKHDDHGHGHDQDAAGDFASMVVGGLIEAMLERNSDPGPSSDADQGLQPGVPAALHGQGLD